MRLFYGRERANRCSFRGFFPRAEVKARDAAGQTYFCRPRWKCRDSTGRNFAFVRSVQRLYVGPLIRSFVRLGIGIYRERYRKSGAL